MEPYIWPDRFYDQYGCMGAGYEESGKKIAEIGREDVNKHDIYIKFECHSYKVIIPKSKKMVSFKVAEVVLKNNPTLWSAVQETKNASTRVLVKPLAQ